MFLMQKEDNMIIFLIQVNLGRLWTTYSKQIVLHSMNIEQRTHDRQGLQCCKIWRSTHFLLYLSHGMDSEACSANTEANILYDAGKTNERGAVFILERRRNTDTKECEGKTNTG